jgi:hypothetical protein
MKEQGLKIIIVVVALSAVVSFFISSAIFGDPETDPVTVDTTNVIVSDFPEPDSDYYNPDSFNPTQLIRIGEEDINISPFGQSD